MSRHRFDHSVDHSDDTKEVSAPPRLRRIEVITGAERRRKWSAEEKAEIVAESLAALVQQALGADPFSGTVYVFRAKRADRVKLVWWDGTGLCLLSKRLEGGQFRWPRNKDGVMRLTPAQLSALVEGLDWARVAAREVERPRAAQ